MRKQTSSDARAVRPAITATGNDRVARLRRISRGCFRRRAAPSTAQRLMAGWRPSPGRGRGRGWRGCILRGAARIRARACRWRRCRGGSRPRSEGGPFQRGRRGGRLSLVVCRAAATTAFRTRPRLLSSAACSRPITPGRDGRSASALRSECRALWSAWRTLGDDRARREGRTRSNDFLEIGPTRRMAKWTLTIRLDEIGAPFPRRIRGEIVSSRGRSIRNRLRWNRMGGISRARSRLSHAPRDFARRSCAGGPWLPIPTLATNRSNSVFPWTWPRASLRDGATILYDAEHQRETHLSLALRFDGLGRYETVEPPPLAPLPPTGWRVARPDPVGRRARPCLNAALRIRPSTLDRLYRPRSAASASRRCMKACRWIASRIQSCA